MAASPASREQDASYPATEDDSFSTTLAFSFTTLPAHNLFTRPPIPILLIALLREAGPGGRSKDEICTNALEV
jgi:hypothetical protein